ncbi:MAG: DUF2270 domain-containing protein [Myxococcaceae bacterium]|nr:DUF2270 domain-containing protein [Myxococcaceae bacterium]MCI0673383.1 DUF2270 domain-containing protein [Myxococcaceae bacterium]
MADRARKSPDLNEALMVSDTAMAHLYRGELSRADLWRTRLDTTSNWALTVTAAVISFTFANPVSPHVPLLAGLWLVVTFLFIEARRYRYYDFYNRRLRLLEDGYWAPLLRREPVDPDAIRELALELERPQLVLSLPSALSVRLNRTYGPILLVLLLTWFVKVYSQPQPITSWSVFLQRAHVGPIPGLAVTITVLFLTAAALGIFILSFFTRAPLGELRTRPRTRRMALWERVYRPYALQNLRSARRSAVAQKTETAH